MTDILPVDGSRNGWNYSTYKRIGAAEIAHTHFRYRADLGTSEAATLYGVYGVRGDEIFVQYEGVRMTDGSTIGRSLIASSMDSDPYIWCPRKGFANVRIFDQKEVGK